MASDFKRNYRKMTITNELHRNNWENTMANDFNRNYKEMTMANDLNRNYWKRTI